MTVTICLGSACHVKGSHAVLVQIKELIGEYGLEDVINMAGRFCADNCQHGVCVHLDEELYSVQPETARDFFLREILPRAVREKASV